VLHSDLLSRVVHLGEPPFLLIARKKSDVLNLMAAAVRNALGEIDINICIS